MKWRNYNYETEGDGIRILSYVPESAEAAECGAEAAGSGEEAAERGAEAAGSGEETACIPPYIDGLPVVEIGADAFSEEGVLLSRVEVPPTVRRIGDGAFRMCLNLTELILNEGLEEIGAEALFLTPLTEVKLPDSVRVIENPSELGSILFTTTGHNPYFYSDGFCLFRRIDDGGPEDARNGDSGRQTDGDPGQPANGDSVQPAAGDPGQHADDRKAEWELLVSLQSDERESYDVPEGTAAIGESAFSGNGYLRRVTMPGTMHRIGWAAFEGCQNLEEITFPEGLREIGGNAFAHCIRLKYMHLPSTVEKIGESALSDTFGWSDSFMGLESITVEPGNEHFTADGEALFEADESGSGCRYLVKYFGEGAVYRVPENVSRILTGAFRRAAFCRCEIPASVRSIGKDAFRECKNLEEICIHEDDAVLYVPGQPIYRKDEVTALFFEERPEQLEGDRERSEGDRERSEGDRKRPEGDREQPEEGRERSEGDQKRLSGGHIYDYRGYDALFSTYLNLPDLCGMACCRLMYPVDLSEERARFYRDFLGNNLIGILKGVSEKQDMERLVMLAELGIFTKENIDGSLDVLSRAGQTKFTGYLLNYMKEHGESGEFDFSL